MRLPQAPLRELGREPLARVLVGIAIIQEEVIEILLDRVQLLDESKPLLERNPIFFRHNVLTEGNNANLLTLLLLLLLTIDGIKLPRKGYKVDHVFEKGSVVEEDDIVFATFEIKVHAVCDDTIHQIDNLEVDGPLRAANLVGIEDSVA